jgi:hypothetical protein
MHLGKMVWRVILMLGLATAAWSTPARAADDAPARSDTTGSVKGALAFLEYFKTSVDSLKLDDETQQKVEGFFAGARKQMGAADKLADKDAAKRATHEVLEKLRFDVSTLLSNEQKLAIQKKLQSAKSSVMIDQIKSKLTNPELHLTADQLEKATAVLEDTKHKLEELRSESPKDSKARADEILAEMKKELGKILSPQSSK